jgi:hypothetical protein
MQVEIFDDWRSIVHSIVGGVSHFFPLISIIFFVYEIAEYFVKHEDIKCTIGDIIEFSIGFTAIGLLV